MKRAAEIALLYTVFAAIATLANIGSQALVVACYRGIYSVELSILIGTAAGLPIKYMLEKRHIFGYVAENLSHDSKLFVLYSIMGTVTTALFWGTEYTFHWMFGSDSMRYVGAAIGLSAGYVIKYHLDKKFVFVSKAPISMGML